MVVPTELRLRLADVFLGDVESSVRHDGDCVLYARGMVWTVGIEWNNRCVQVCFSFEF